MLGVPDLIQEIVGIADFGIPKIPKLVQLVGRYQGSVLLSSLAPRFAMSESSLALLERATLIKQGAEAVSLSGS
jgi:hypothetical protein